MSTYAQDERDPFKSSLTGALVLHAAFFASLIGYGVIQHLRSPSLGEATAAAGSIQASMVSAIPLPPKAAPVDKSVLASDDTTPAPAPQPKDAVIPPPRPDDVLLKAKTPDKAVTKPTPTPTTAVKHPQPTPETPKANTGDVATQIPLATMQTVNGTASITVENRALGQRYAYYIRLIGNKVQQFYGQEYPDPRSSQGKSVIITFFVDTSGSPANIQIQTASGSPSLDSAGKRAVQEVDTFGPNPAGVSIPIQIQFDYQHR